MDKAYPFLKTVIDVPLSLILENRLIFEPIKNRKRTIRTKFFASKRSIYPANIHVLSNKSRFEKYSNARILFFFSFYGVKSKKSMRCKIKQYHQKVAKVTSMCMAHALQLTCVLVDF